MSAPFNTLYLTVDTWDLTADASGNIAMAAPPYAITQDVASACRTFLGEVYYDTTLGVPYLGNTQNVESPGAQLLGRTPALNILQGALAAAAITVPDVKSASCVVSAFQNRVASGQVQFTTEDDVSFTVAIGAAVSSGAGVPVIPLGTLFTESGQILSGESGGGIQEG